MIGELSECGLTRSGEELMLLFLEKLGPNRRAEVMRDRRLWPALDGAPGETEYRTVETWKEASKVCAELERIDADQKAIKTGVDAGGGPTANGGNKGKVYAAVAAFEANIAGKDRRGKNKRND